MFTWKALNGKKPQEPTDSNYHYRRKVQSEPQRQRTRSLYLRQPVVTTEYRSVSLSLSLYVALSIQQYDNNNNITK